MKVLNLTIFLKNTDSSIINLNGIFKENANILATENNCQVINNIYNIDNGDTVFVFGSHSCPMELLYYKRNKDIKYIIIQTENLNSIVFQNEYYIKLLKNTQVWDWSYFNRNELKNRFDIKVDKIYDFEFNQVYNTYKNRQIDLFFCGGGNDFRINILNKIKEKFPNLNCKFFLNYNLVDNEELTNLLISSKVVLNIPFYQPSVLATHRINKALACGCEVISMPSCDKLLDKKYKRKIKFGENLIALIGKRFKTSESNSSD